MRMYLVPHDCEVFNETPHAEKIAKRVPKFEKTTNRINAVRRQSIRASRSGGKTKRRIRNRHNTYRHAIVVVKMRDSLLLLLDIF